MMSAQAPQPPAETHRAPGKSGEHVLQPANLDVAFNGARPGPFVHGVVAHHQADVVAENVARVLAGEPDEVAYDVRINCLMKVGGHKALVVSATFERPAQLEWIMRPYFGRTSHEKLQGVGT